MPKRVDESDFLPDGISTNHNNCDTVVDFFYIHGTGNTNDQRWASPLKRNNPTAKSRNRIIHPDLLTFHNYLACCIPIATMKPDTNLISYLKIRT